MPPPLLLPPHHLAPVCPACARVVSSCHVRCCEFLIQNGADVRSFDDRQCTPLDLACLGNQVREELFLFFGFYFCVSEIG